MLGTRPRARTTWKRAVPKPIGTSVTPAINVYFPRHIVLAVQHLNAFAFLTLAHTEGVELHSMTETAAQPLIPSTREYPSDARYSNDDEDVEIDESALVSPGWFIWILTVCAGVSGLLFGYEYVSRFPHVDMY